MGSKTLSVGTTEVNMIGFNSNRVMLTVTNEHSSAIVHFSDAQGEPAAGLGFTVFPRTPVTIAKVDGDKPEKQFWIISDTAATPVKLKWEVKA